MMPFVGLQAEALPDAGHLLLVNVAIVLMLVAFIGALTVVLVRRSVQARIQAARLAAMGTATARILHQVKNPIQTVILHAEMLEDARLMEDADAREEVGGALVEEAVRLSGLLEELSMFASGAARRLTPEPLRLDELAREAVAGEAAAAEADRVALVTDLNAVEIRADPYFMRHALDNMIRNAREALVEDGTPEPAIRVETGMEGGDAVVRIVDNGPGIPAAERAGVFEPFVTTKGKGMGLGLAVVRDIVEGHGGAVALRERDGGGTEAVITLPRARTSEASEP